MCLHPHDVPAIPDYTARVARAAFRKGNLFMRMRVEMWTIYRDDAFAARFPPRRQPAEAPLRLAMVTVMQYVEGLPDARAADAVRFHDPSALMNKRRIRRADGSPSVDYFNCHIDREAGGQCDVLCERTTRPEGSAGCWIVGVLGRRSPE